MENQGFADNKGQGQPPPYPDQHAGYPPPAHTQYGQAPAYYPQQPQHGNNVVVTAGPPQVYVQPGASGPMPDNNMGLAIFTTLCCFWPLGIMAIIKSSEVSSKWTVGDGQGARNAAAQSRQFSLIAVGIGIAAYIICGVIVGVYVSTALSYGY